MKRIMVAASMVVLGASLTACGGGSSAPTDASQADFCGQYVKVLDALMGQEDTDKAVDDLKAWADEMENVGTPKDISEKARKGFEVSLDQMDDLNADDLKDAKGGTLPEVEVSKEDEEAATEFATYVQSTCSAEIEKATQDLMGSMTEGMEGTEGTE